MELAGNVTNDGTHSYSYDAEGRVATVDGGATATYVYDASGRRARKISGGAVDYVYDLGGHVISEFSASGNWNRGEVYAGGQHVATYDGGTTYFTHADWLGTERVRSTVDGTVYSTWTSFPFGEGSAAPNPSPTHFTGKERDFESGNDYFGARYYASSMGRFLSPDWSAKREPIPYAKLDNPQSLNHYAYVFNNPLSHIDADGHATWFDPKGKKIGTDGVNDGGVVIAQRNSVAFSPDHSIIDMAASGTPMYSFSKEEIGAMKDSVARTLAPSTTGDMKGGFHEEGFTEKGGAITPAAAGPGYKPGDSEAQCQRANRSRYDASGTHSSERIRCHIRRDEI